VDDAALLNDPLFERVRGASYAEWMIGADGPIDSSLGGQWMCRVSHDRAHAGDRRR